VTWRRWGCAAGLAFAVLAAPEAAYAHGGQGAAQAILVAALGDVVFTTYDLVALAGDERGSGWLVAQGIWATPQAVLLDIEPFDSAGIPLGVGIWLNQLTAFSLYGLWDKQASASSLYGISWAMGANAALTTHIAAAAFDGRFLPPSQAITALVASVPQMALALYAIESPESLSEQRQAVLLLGAWSAGIFSHGAASLFFYRPKPPPRAEATWKLTPTVLAAQRGLAPALSVRGAF